MPRASRCHGDVLGMMVNGPYDWNGPRESVVCAAVTMTCETAGIQPVVLGPAGQERIPPIWELVG